MFAAAICVSILLGVLVWALPGRLCDRRATHADVLAGPGIVLAVWIIAACVFAQPGLAQGFDLFRLLAINGVALWACGTVLLLRLRRGRRYRTLWTVAALLIAAIGLEVFVGNAPYFATHGYQPVDLRAYLQDAPADGEPIALNDEHSTLTFTGIQQPLYNVALDGVVYQYDGNYPQDQNPLFILWVSGTDEASTAPRQSWQWQAAPRAARSLVRTLDFSGAVDTLTLQAEGYSGEYRSYDLNYTVQAVLANVPRPMDFSLLRLAVVYLALLALWGLRPGAAAWHEAYLTHRGFRIGRLAPALFTYFLSLPVVQAVFPYLAGTKMQTNFMGMTITEVFYGGALVSLPLLWAFAALPLLRRRMARQKGLRAMVLLPVLLAVILAALDCQMAGVLYRYLSDYLTPLLFAAALVWLWAESALAPRVQAAASGSILHTVQHMLQGAMLAAVAVGICYSFCVYFAAEPGLLGQNPALYQNVSRLVQFWL